MTTSIVQSDHDLLIVLHTEVKALRADIQAMSETTGKKVEDHENRIRSMEKAIWKWSGGAAAVGALASYALTHLLK